MAAFEVDTYRSLLATPLHKKGGSGVVCKKRLDNILWIKSLSERIPREKQVVIRTTDHGEILYLKHPGKEAKLKLKTRPWDFRPHLLKADGKDIGKLGFKDIWHTLVEILAQSRDKEPDLAPALAILFYRMAFMEDHQHRENEIFEVEYERAGQAEIVRERLGAVWEYKPPTAVMDAIQEIVPLWKGVSLEAFLHYNELLVWNEDCKYYYRDKVEKEVEWGCPAIGRVNTLLTYLNIIGLVMGETLPHGAKKISINVDAEYLANLLGDISRQGVAPASHEKITKMSNRLIGDSEGISRFL